MLFGSFSAASAGGDLRQEPLSTSEPLIEEAHARADSENAGVAQATPDSTAPVPLGEMSDEEKERRRDACVTMFDDCEDRCYKSKKRGSDFRICREKCVNSLANCMKKIPY